MLLPGETVPVAALGGLGMVLLGLAVAVIWVLHLRDERRFRAAIGGRRAPEAAHWNPVYFPLSFRVSAGGAGSAVTIVLLLVADLALRLILHTDLGTILVAPLERFLDARL